ncbi:MAG TPA: hypothetical protein PLY68_09840 [Myxococcota bacterium]|nr:hypothetical protein [Myxococcota bacterium]HNZ02783.1 hypothetical protein [Myxococcota bacterium]HOD07206.1 hypothetical protein [Myxococcota bacterium]HPB51131.1 hypothetical protein [Myxococcota bacterium]HQP96480.1 hypothetical protein [Myxococcota bacterium]
MRSYAKFAFAVAAAALLCTVSTSALALDGDMIQFQGFLTDDLGVPITGERSISVAIYDAPEAGNSLWSQNQTVVVTNGQFSMLLGSGTTPLSEDFFGGIPVWIGVTVEADDEMVPRHPVTHVPYSIRARRADWSERCGDADSVSWGGLTSLPAGFADGVDDTLTEDDVLGMVGNVGYIKSDALEGYSTTAQLTATLEDYAALDHVHVWGDISDVPVSCAAGQALKSSGTAWVCGDDLSNSYTGSDFAMSTQACGIGQKVTGIDMNGFVMCDVDLDSDTLYDGSDFVPSSQMCDPGYVVSGFDPDGIAICGPDNDTTYTGANFAKSNQTCPEGSVVRAIDASGNLTCVVPAGGSSFADPVFGSGESGQLNITTPTVWNATDAARVTAQYSSITISSSLSVPSGTMLRCSGNFTLTSTGSITVRSGYDGITFDPMNAAPGLALSTASGSNGLISLKLPATEAAQIMRAPALSGTSGALGSGVITGGFGGGGLTIRAKGIVSIAGSIIADGAAGATGVQGAGGGGGSGGFVILMSKTSISNTGAIAARGGNGGAATQSSGGLLRSGGAGGGGGIVHMVAPAITAGTVHLNGGTAGANAAGGASSLDGKGGGGLGGNGGNPGLDGGSSGPGEAGLQLQTVTANPENLVL